MGVKIGGSIAPIIQKDEVHINKDAYLELARGYIKREGLEDLLTWLEGTDFFVAPASTQFHGNMRGGLCMHSLAVFNYVQKLSTLFFGVDWATQVVDPELQKDRESLALVALFHDLCKTDFYILSKRNVKNKDTGKWEAVPFYAIEDQMPLGHGEKSVILAMEHMKLTKDEKIAISWHMGGFDDRAREYGGGKSLYQAKRNCPLLTVLSMADEASAFLNDM